MTYYVFFMLIDIHERRNSQSIYRKYKRLGLKGCKLKVDFVGIL